jgi:hypothetical protein
VCSRGHEWIERCRERAPPGSLLNSYVATSVDDLGNGSGSPTVRVSSASGRGDWAARGDVPDPRGGRHDDRTRPCLRGRKGTMQAEGRRWTLSIWEMSAKMSSSGELL